MYTFFLETATGERIEWRGLTLRQAQNMHRATDARIPDNVRRFGWEAAE